MKSLHKNVIRNEVEQSSQVSNWLPEELVSNQDSSSGKVIKPLFTGSSDERVPFSFLNEKERLESIFIKNKSVIEEQPYLVHNVLPPNHQTSVFAWEPNTVSYYSPDVVTVYSDEIQEEFEYEGEEELDRETVSEDLAQALEAQRKAEEMKEKAETEATLLVQNALDQVEQIRKEAHELGLQQTRLEATVILQSAQIVLDEAKKWRDTVIQRSEESLIALLQIIAGKLFGEGFVLEPEMVERMVVRAISESTRLGNLRVYLNPLDEEKLVSLWQESELNVNGQKIQLVSSQNIEPGGCFIEGEFGSVDSRIGMQLELIQSEIRQVLSSREELEL